MTDSGPMDIRSRIVIAIVESLIDGDPLVNISIGDESISVYWPSVSYHPEPFG